MKLQREYAGIDASIWRCGQYPCRVHSAESSAICLFVDPGDRGRNCTAVQLLQRGSAATTSRRVILRRFPPALRRPFMWLATARKLL